MADKMSKGMLSSELHHPCDESGVNDDDMRCLICDADVVTHNSYNILYTVIGNSGSLLCDNINKVLRRRLEVFTARSTIICRRCFSLFSELDAAENKCAIIKKEIESTYLKTCKTYEYEPPFNVPGVACQTEDDFESMQSSENQGDLKLKITLTPKRRRGRPVKSQQQKQSLSDDSTMVVSGAEENRDSKKSKRLMDQAEKEVLITENVEEIVKSRQTRSTTKNSAKKKSLKIMKIGKEISSEEKKLELTMNDVVKLENNIIEIENEITAASEPKNEEIQSQNLVNEDQNNDVNNDDDNDDDDDDDDDFEWKEESTIENYGESAESDDCNEESSIDKTEDDSQSGGSKDGKKKQKGKKKRKPGDRKGERAFMVPIHECNQCGKKWRTVTELKSHIASHSDVRPYVCEICGQAYKMKKALDIHIGMHNGIHPFVCQYCNKSFTQKVGLEKHLPIHTGVTRFQCDLCGKRFIHQKSFNIHKMTHTGEKNIHCPICKLAVFSQSHLKRHYRVHTGERPYGCNICGKKFAEKYNLNAHIRIHDPNSAGEGRRRNHTCPICGMTYDRKNKIADHLSSVHGMWQSSSLDFKSDDFFNVDVQTVENQHHLQPLHIQETSVVQIQQAQTVLPPQQPGLHSHQPQQTPQSQPSQMNTPLQHPSQPPQPSQPPSQISQAPQSRQHHLVVHHTQQQLHQQHPPHHLQQQHIQSSGPPHHILLTQHQIQPTFQTHIPQHPTATSATITVTAATPPALQPISSVFQLVSVPPSSPESVATHHNRMSTVSTSMPVSTL